ncbi:MAG: hypothetical protein WKF30_17545 [Pyrinomonadaceae bacterium]
MFNLVLWGQAKRNYEGDVKTAMLCAEFEDRLTDYLDNTLEGDAHRCFGEHALRCPVCHELLGAVKSSVNACRTITHPPTPATLEARILQTTTPGLAMTCQEFEEHLTDYLDGFLSASLYHRWERHAVLCGDCTDLPGQVVRSIGACYSYIKEERPLPIELQARILQATLGTINARELRATAGSRVAERLRMWLDSFVSPQLATVATMLLVAVLVGTTTISDDGSIGGMYRVGLRMATENYVRGATAALPPELKNLASDLVNLGDKQKDQAEQQK